MLQAHFVRVLQVAGFHGYPNCEAVDFSFQPGDVEGIKLECLHICCFSKI